jgi:hypothetical protein
VTRRRRDHRTLPAIDAAFLANASPFAAFRRIGPTTIARVDGKSRTRAMAVVKRAGTARTETKIAAEDQRLTEISLLFMRFRKTRGWSSVPSSRRKAWFASSSTLLMSSFNTRCKR